MRAQAVVESPIAPSSGSCGKRRLDVAPSPVHVGLLGCGHVGSAVARRLVGNSEALAAACGGEVPLARVAVEHLGKPRSVELPVGILTDDALAVAIDPGIDVVIELIGGIEPARTAILAALADGKSVVTANKQLLATDGAELFACAARHGVDLFFEGSVGGAIPIVSALRAGAGVDRVTKIEAVINGTTNFVLTEMQRTGCSLEEALGSARALGYAEADPAADISGADAAAKAAILATIAWGEFVSLDEVAYDGIDEVDAASVARAARGGLVLKLIAGLEKRDGSRDVSVGVRALPRSHPLANLEGVTNGIIIHFERAGEVILSGPGAGGEPTASAVLIDLFAAARNRS